MADTFEKGDIVTEKPEYYSPRGDGQVIEVEVDGYVSVRFVGGTVFSFWPHELVQTGRKIDPEVVPVLERMDKAIAEAESTLQKLRTLRDGVMALGMKEKS